MDNEEKLKKAKNERIPKISETKDFYHKSTKWVVLGLSLGIFFSLIYLLLAQPRYIAKSSIILSSLKKESDFSFDELFKRLNNPSSYKANANGVCMPVGDSMSLNNNLKVTLSNPNKIEFSYISPQPKEAVACLEKVFLIVDEYYKENISKILIAKEKDIINLQDKIGVIKSVIRADADSQAIAVVNLLMVPDGLMSYIEKFLELKIDINNLKQSAENGAKPSEITVKLESPNRKLIVLNGLFSGLILGLLLQLFWSVKLSQKKSE